MKRVPVLLTLAIVLSIAGGVAAVLLVQRSGPQGPIVSESGVSARVTVLARDVRPGAHFPLVITNTGSSPIAFGYAFSLQRSDGFGWQDVPVHVAVILPLIVLGPGASHSIGVVLPTDAAAGHYRVLTSLTSAGNHTEQAIGAAQFTVTT